MIIPLSAGSAGGALSFISRRVFMSSLAIMRLRCRLWLAGITYQGAWLVEVARSALS
jgi:hypothetical protein